MPQLKTFELAMMFLPHRDEGSVVSVFLFIIFVLFYIFMLCEFVLFFGRTITRLRSRIFRSLPAISLVLAAAFFLLGLAYQCLRFEIGTALSIILVFILVAGPPARLAYLFRQGRDEYGFHVLYGSALLVMCMPAGYVCLYGIGALSSSSMSLFY
jgi:hypothetical protein